MTHKGLVEEKSEFGSLNSEERGFLQEGRESREGEVLGIRVNGSNRHHHLWNNNGTWFIHYTVYPTPLTAKRVRRSLKTKSLAVAIRRRDSILQRKPETGSLRPETAAYIAAGI